MTQPDLFAGLLRTLMPKRRAKASVVAKTATPVGPRILHVDMAGRRVAVHVHKKSSARHYTLSLTRDGAAVRLSMPRRASLQAGLAFVQEKQALVAKWLAETDHSSRIAPGHHVMFNGTPHKIVWHVDLPRRVFCAEHEIRVGGPQELAGKRVIRWLKAQALADVTQTVQAIAAAHDIQVTKIAVNDAQARWGSCSSEGAINFSWRVILIPPAARHYVVCHELAHRTYMNHSPAFWREVERLGGDLSQRAWFKTKAARQALACR